MLDAELLAVVFAVPCVHDRMMNLLPAFIEYMGFCLKVKMAFLLFPRAARQVPQSRWLKTNEMYHLVVLEARCLKARCQQDHDPSEP